MRGAVVDGATRPPPAPTLTRAADDRLTLRATFDEDALLYDRARPTYPHPSARRTGYRVLAVDLGPGMVEVARRNLAPFPLVEVVHADADQWNPPAACFDLVLSATAFH